MYSITEAELIDKSFMFLHSENMAVSPRYLEDSFKKNNINISNPIRVLETICSNDFAEKEINRQATMGANTNIYNYSINAKGINFIETLPDDFKDKPYSYYLKLLANKETKNKESEVLSEQKLKIDLVNAKRIFKTYWWTFGISIAALLISLSLLILRIMGR